MLDEAALVVLPYRRRADSSGILAMALGSARPVVVSDVGGIGETVARFGAGDVVPPGDVSALAAACVRSLTDDDARARSYSGTIAARDELSWETTAELHEQLYEGIRAPTLPTV
jgi:glycosyltransferase involved in cell wall biosynthesis